MSKTSASHGGDDADADGQHPPVDAGRDVLRRDGGRVDVGEGLVDLVDDEDEQGHRPGGHGEQGVDDVEAGLRGP